MYSLALKIVNLELDNRVACNMLIPNANSEDDYIIKDITETYKELRVGNSKKGKLRVFVESVCEGNLLQQASEKEGREIYTEIGEEAVGKLIDTMEGLAIKYHPNVLYKANYALL